MQVTVDSTQVVMRGKDFLRIVPSCHLACCVDNLNKHLEVFWRTLLNYLSFTAGHFCKKCGGKAFGNGNYAFALISREHSAAWRRLERRAVSVAFPWNLKLYNVPQHYINIDVQTSGFSKDKLRMNTNAW